MASLQLEASKESASLDWHFCGEHHIYHGDFAESCVGEGTFIKLVENITCTMVTRKYHAYIVKIYVTPIQAQDRKSSLDCCSQKLA